MPSASRVILSVAGSGKTTRAVEQALANREGVTALVTYTRNNIREIENKILERERAVPSRIEVISWYTFLLHELARPYRAALHDKRIDGIQFVQGKSLWGIPAWKIGPFYFKGGNQIYQDKLAQFACACDEKTEGAVMRRLAQRFSHIIIDEVQDLAGYDLELVERMLKAGIAMTFIGDHRQATLTTHHASKNKAYAKASIVKKFEDWRDAGLLAIEFESHTHRCNQAIADLSDSLFPGLPRTQSLNRVVTGHDGIFAVRSADIGKYVETFTPQVLRFSAATNCEPHRALNFGESKGMTFDRVLIFPHGPTLKWLVTGDTSQVDKSLTKLYVAITRARFSVAFVLDKTQSQIDAKLWVQ